MAQKPGKSVSELESRRFPPEADGDFDVVPENAIAAWREKLNERFGLGKGTLKVIEEPT